MDAMIKGYHQAGWKVFLLAMNTSRHHVSTAIKSRLYSYIEHFETVEVDNSIKPIPVLWNFLFRKTPEHADRFLNKAFGDKLRSILQKFQPDVVQMESIYLNVYLEIIRNNSKALLVQRLHNVEWHIWQRLARDTKHVMKRWYFRVLAERIRVFELQAWKDADLLLPITSADANVITNSGCKTHLHITPFGIDLKESAEREEDVPVVYWQGYHLAAMDWIPNQEAMQWFVHDIWPLIHEALPQFKFHFAGRSMPDFLRKQLPEGVHCAGEVSEAGAFIKDKQILIVPLRAGGGIRVKILEAMSLGKLVISTTIGMQGIEATPGIHFLRADTPEEFRDRLLEVFNNPNRAVEIARNGYHLIQSSFDSRQIIGGLVRVIEEAILH